jgi:hypothetical protein
MDELRMHWRSALNRLGVFLLLAALTTWLGQRLFFAGLAREGQLVSGGIMMLGAAVMFFFRRTVPAPMAAILSLGIIFYTLTILGLLPLSPSVGGIISSVSLMLFVLLEHRGRTKTSPSQKS